MRAHAVILTCGPLLVACGRFAFDPLTDGGATDDADAAPAVCLAPVGHDEDADGIDDACDTCPHLAASNTDVDVDGVGDACDPYPTPGETLDVFEPFRTVSTALWTYPAEAIVANDAVALPAVGGSLTLYLNRTPTTERMAIAGDIGAGGTGQRQMAIGISDFPYTQSIFCELSEIAGANALRLVHRSPGPIFTSIAEIPAPLPLANGPVTLEIETARPRVICRARWRGAVLTVQGDVPGTAVVTEPYFSANNIDLSIRSFVRITTTP